MANNGKQNIAKHIIKVKNTTFSAEKYTYPTNLYAGSSPYLHSSANTFGSAARTLWTPLQGVTLSLWDDGAIPALIQKQQKRESAVYAHFNNDPDKFFSLLTANNSVIEATNLQAIDASYEEAFKIINDNLEDIINSAKNYIGYKKSYSSQDMKTKTLQLAKFISKKFSTNEETSQQLMDLFKYSPRKSKKEEDDMKQYFFLRALREYAQNKQPILNATELNKYIETEYIKSWSGKINNLVGDYGEKQVVKALEEMFKGTNVSVNASGRDKSLNDSGKQQTNVGDIMIDFGDINAALSVKTTGHYKRKESKDVEEVFNMSDFKFRDTSAEALLKYYNNSVLKDFLRYLLINIMFFKGGESNPVFVGQSGIVGKSGLKAVENIVNDIISVTLPFIMLNHSTPELNTDFIVNARTGEITPASVLLERIYVATKHYDERKGGYRAARGLVTVSSYRTNTEKMNERKAAKLDPKDTNFSYPSNLLEIGQEYGAAQWNGGKGLPLSIRISQVKEKIQELEKQALL